MVYCINVIFKIKVFHQNYIQENISTVDNVKHIFSVGKDQTEKIEEVMRLKGEAKKQEAYYEELFSRVGDVEDLRALRTDFLCNEFWAFVLDELEEVAASGIGKASINRELCSVVNCLFRCDISAQTRATLGKVNEKLSQIFVG